MTVNCVPVLDRIFYACVCVRFSSSVFVAATAIATAPISIVIFSFCLLFCALFYWCYVAGLKKSCYFVFCLLQKKRVSRTTSNVHSVHTAHGKCQSGESEFESLNTFLHFYRKCFVSLFFAVCVNAKNSIRPAHSLSKQKKTTTTTCVFPGKCESRIESGMMITG